jgi:hypothetical protein
MFVRDYMDYHSQRFNDFSLMVYNDSELIAVLPANLKDSIIYSHQGLTFGGLIMSHKATADLVINIFEKITWFYKEMNINKIVYKAIPYIYHSYTSDEDLYALTRLNACLVRRDISSAICLRSKLPFRELRKRSLRKAIKKQLVIKEITDFEVYWSLLSQVLSAKHNNVPVHTLEEITHLANSFPDNIKLVTAYSAGGVLLAGCVLYINRDVVHTQYIASSDDGKMVGALDLIMDYLINEKYVNKQFFDFGISTEDNGKFLNNGLIFQKEGFGARGVVHDFYEVSLK